MRTTPKLFICISKILPLEKTTAGANFKKTAKVKTYNNSTARRQVLQQQRRRKPRTDHFKLALSNEYQYIGFLIDILVLAQSLTEPQGQIYSAPILIKSFDSES